MRADKKPDRPDINYLTAFVKLVNTVKVFVVMLLIGIIALIITVAFMYKRSMLVSIIDTSTGRTYISKTYVKLGDDIIKRQLLYYSKEFCESWWSLDWETIKNDRVYALKMIHPSGPIRTKIPADYADDATVNATINIHNRSSFEWNKLPEITRNEDPYYTVYCEFNRTSGPENRKSQTETFFVKIQWYREKEFNPYERSHGYYVADLSKLEYGSVEWKTEINKLK
ncbi:MAG: hypothetical protein GX640_04160 [Fibrobacter sp.]|nr:hypothetical protein [Fibrobacter sp.]